MMDIEIRFLVAVDDTTHAQELLDHLRAEIETEVWTSSWAVVGPIEPIGAGE